MARIIEAGTVMGSLFVTSVRGKAILQPTILLLLQLLLPLLPLLLLLQEDLLRELLVYMLSASVTMPFIRSLRVRLFLVLL